MKLSLFLQHAGFRGLGTAMFAGLALLCFVWPRDVMNAQEARAAACESLGTRFQVAPQSALGRLPQAIATGDFNNDKYADLAVTNVSSQGATQIAIMLGNGRGQFAPVSSAISSGAQGISSAPKGLVVADFTRDGRADLAYSLTSRGVVVLASRGDGTFSNAGTLLPDLPSSALLLAGDFNGDRRNDLAIAASNGVVSILHGNGDGGFAPGTSFSVGATIYAIGAADLNNDLLPDLVVLAGSSSAVYLKTAGGTFTRGQSINSSFSNVLLSLADFNGDGKIDLIYSENSSFMSLRLGDGAGGLGNPSSLSSSGFAITTADLNKDLRADLIAFNNNVSIQLGGATGLGQRIEYAAGRGANDGVVIDVNNDGALDLLALNRTSGTLSLFWGDNSGRWSAPVSLGSREGTNSLKSDDLNKDGRPDFIVTGGSTGATSIWLSNSAGGYTTQVYGFTFSSYDYRSAVVGDFTGDGTPDLATISNSGFGATAGLLSVFPGTGPGTFNRDRGRDFDVGSNPDSLAAGDFNRDGLADVAFANLGSNDLSILFNDGRGGFGPELRLTTGLEPRSLQTADFNGDNRLDLIVANRNGATLTMFLAEESRRFRTVPIGIDANPRQVIVADLNRDGKPDLVIPNNNKPCVTTLLNIGGGNFDSPIAVELGRQPFDTVVADFSGDGKLDLAITGFAGGSENPNELVQIFRGDNAGTFVFAEEFRLPTAAYLAAGDINADGLQDLAISGGPGILTVLNGCNSNAPPALANVSAASYRPVLFSPEMIVSAFGKDLTTQAVSATGLPLPTELGGVSIRVKDSLGIERPAPLFFVSPTQVNYLLPPEGSSGVAEVKMTTADKKTFTESVVVASSSPGLFTANADGAGVPAAYLLRIKFPGGERSIEPIARFDAATQRFVPVPINFGFGSDPAADQLYLVLFGTGIRGRNSLTDVSAELAGVASSSQVVFAGPQGTLAGLDQVNVRLFSNNLRGRGEISLILSVAGNPSNPVRIAFQ